MIEAIDSIDTIDTIASIASIASIDTIASIESIASIPPRSSDYSGSISPKGNPLALVLFCVVDTRP